MVGPRARSPSERLRVKLALQLLDLALEVVHQRVCGRHICLRAGHLGLGPRCFDRAI